MDKTSPDNQSITMQVDSNTQPMRLTYRGADSFSNNSKSMSKISDNASDGSYNNQNLKKKANIEKFRHTKQGALGGSSVGGISDMKVEGGKT